MAEYSPQAIYSLFNAIQAKIPSAELSGIIGDQAHTYGYHRGAAYIPSGDYSRQFSDDRYAIDDQAASALDVGLPPDQMRAVSTRLMHASLTGDPGLTQVREWYGTIDGQTVTGYDLPSGTLATSDPTHLFHIHMSFYRRYATNTAALAPIAAVFTGTTPHQEEDMTPEQAALQEKIYARLGWIINGRSEDPNTPGDQHIDGLAQIHDRLVALESKLGAKT